MGLLGQVATGLVSSQGHSDLQWLSVLPCLFILYCFPAAVPRNHTLIRKKRHIHISPLSLFCTHRPIWTKRRKGDLKVDAKETTLASARHTHAHKKTPKQPFSKGHLQFLLHCFINPFTSVCLESTRVSYMIVLSAHERVVRITGNGTQTQNEAHNVNNVSE